MLCVDCEVPRAGSRLVFQVLSKDKGIAREKFSKHDGHSKELGIPWTRKMIRVYMHLHP